MGVSTNGILCYGVRFDEGHEFPWDGDEHNGDLESWWRAVNGYKEPFPLYGPDGNYLPGIPLKPPRYPGNKEATDEVMNRYFKPQEEWDKAHPLPVELVNYCSGDYAAYIVAVPSSVVTAHRGCPKQLNPHQLSVSVLEESALKAFCDKHGLQGEGPAWWLCSYWG